MAELPNLNECAWKDKESGKSKALNHERCMNTSCCEPWKVVKVVVNDMLTPIQMGQNRMVDQVTQSCCARLMHGPN